MRIILLFTICIFFSSASSAHDPAINLIFPEKPADAADSIKQNHLLLGFNLTQVLVGDVELHIMYRFKKRYSIMASAGYDFNFLDFGHTLSPEDQCYGCNHESESQSNEEGRYFWGNGPAYRIILSDNFSNDNGSHFFISLYSLLKYHNYVNYYYGEIPSKFSESARQKIFGLGFYFGYEVVKKNFLLRPYGGIGFRTIESKISRPEIYQAQTLVYPGENFTDSHAYPSLDFGLVFLFRVM